jgi:hypothetical protein
LRLGLREITWLIFKRVLIACGGLIGLGIAVWIGILAYNWYSYDRHAQNVGFISTDRKDCTDDRWPIHLIVGNELTIEKVTFTFAARYPGRSSDLGRVLINALRLL